MPSGTATATANMRPSNTDFGACDRCCAGEAGQDRRIACAVPRARGRGEVGRQCDTLRLAKPRGLQCGTLQGRTERNARLMRRRSDGRPWPRTLVTAQPNAAPAHGSADNAKSSAHSPNQGTAGMSVTRRRTALRGAGARDAEWIASTCVPSWPAAIACSVLCCCPLWGWAAVLELRFVKNLKLLPSSNFPYFLKYYKTCLRKDVLFCSFCALIKQHKRDFRV